MMAIVGHSCYTYLKISGIGIMKCRHWTERIRVWPAGRGKSTPCFGYPLLYYEPLDPHFAHYSWDLIVAEDSRPEP
jgi:hypothetical protein